MDGEYSDWQFGGQTYIELINQLKRMDNLSLQLSPLEVSRLPSAPGQLSCLLKKIAISTGHTLEKHTIMGVDAGQGTVRFPNGPTLSLSKELELNNTKLSLHFMCKQAKRVSCIGSAEVDLGCLPQQPVTKYTCPLTNSLHPQASLSFELKRNETRPLPKPARKKPQEMNILYTEGQIKEQLMVRRRKDPNLPTAYEISRKNYKQQEVCREGTERSSNRLANSHSRKPSPNSSISQVHQRSNISYHQRYAGKVDTVKAFRDESPAPRQKTPEPIRPTGYRKQKTEQSTWSKREQGSVGPREEPHQYRQQVREEPSRLEVRPYQEYSSVGSETEGVTSSVRKDNWQSCEPHYSGQSSSGFKQGKYLDITQKLQTIQDQLMSIEAKRFRTDSAHQQQQEERLFDAKPAGQPLQRTPEPESHFTSVGLQEGQSRLTGPLESTFREGASQTEEEVATFREKKAEDVVVGSGKQVDGSRVKKDRIVNQELENQNQELVRENEILKANSFEAEATLRKLMGELEEAIKSRGLAQEENEHLKQVVGEQEQKLQSQASLLDKMAIQFEEKGDQVLLLEEQLAARGSQPQEEQQWKIKAVQAESSLRIKENELKHLKLEMDNLQAEKRQLALEAEALAAKNSQEMGRQKSLAHIQQIASNSLASVTQRENQSLRAEVKILQTKLSSLNDMLQSLLQGEAQHQARKETDRERDGRERQWEENRKLLETQCSALQEELRTKKNLMGEMVNLIWSQGDAVLMEKIEKLIDSLENN